MRVSWLMAKSMGRYAGRRAVLSFGPRAILPGPHSPMICSMTGYAALTRELPSGTLNLELRSVNHRYLDIQFRMPDELRPQEPAMRELLTAQLARGKVDCRVGFAQTPAA